MTEFTVAIIKPDAVKLRRVGPILTEMERFFEVAEVATAHWPRGFAEQFYQEHQHRPFFMDLTAFMSSSLLVMVLLTGPGVVDGWRQAMGATDPMKAAPQSIRYRYSAKDGVMMHNAVHGSDLPASAEREMRLIRTSLYARTREMPHGGPILPNFGGSLLR